MEADSMEEEEGSGAAAAPAGLALVQVEVDAPDDSDIDDEWADDARRVVPRLAASGSSGSVRSSCSGRCFPEHDLGTAAGAQECKVAKGMGKGVGGAAAATAAEAEERAGLLAAIDLVYPGMHPSAWATARLRHFAADMPSG